MDVSSTTVQGVETACADQGAGEAILCLHGWGANLRYWRKLWPRALPRFRCLAPDLPGFGLSGKPADAPYTIDWYVEWVAALLESKGVTSAVVVGHSMGGMIALLLAARHPERVRRLVLLNPVVQGPTALSPRTKFIMAPVIRRLFFAAAQLFSLTFLRWASKDFVATTPMEDEDLLSIRRATFRSLTRSYRSLSATDVLPEAAKIRTMTLLLSSALDRIIDPEQQQLLSRALPLVKLVTLPEVGHCAQLEMPDRFNSTLLSFLEDVPRPLRPRQW